MKNNEPKGPSLSAKILAGVMALMLLAGSVFAVLAFIIQ